MSPFWYPLLLLFLARKKLTVKKVITIIISSIIFNAFPFKILKYSSSVIMNVNIIILINMYINDFK